MPNKTEIVIKPANKNEAFEIAWNLPEFFNEVGLASLKKDLDTHDLHGAFVGDQLVGFMTLRKADTHSLEVSWLAVKTEFQRQGIGTRLVRNLLDQYSKKGYKICYVKTLAETVPDDGYDRTRKFYKNLGFNTLEIIDPYPSWSAGNPCQILAVGLPL